MDIMDKISSGIDVLEAYADNESNHATISLLSESLVKLLKHILPGRLRGDVTFGFEDPYYTGKVLQYAAMLYPVFHFLQVHPLFDEKRLEGEMEFKGKIRLSYVLWIAAKVYFNRDFRRSDIWKKIHQ